MSFVQFFKIALDTYVKTYKTYVFKAIKKNTHTKDMRHYHPCFEEKCYGNFLA